MSVVVLSCGRTGTNVSLEILRGSNQLEASKEVEDRELFKRGIVYPNNYLTKMDTTYIQSDDVITLLTQNSNMKIIWTIRDPRDICLSKIYRGLPNTEGRGNWTSADGTISNSEKDIRHMFSIYKNTIKEFPDRVKLIKLENMLLKTEKTAKSMCEFLNIDYEENMTLFPLRMRNQHKKKRYGDKIDTDQISLWKNLETNYDGFFESRKIEMETLFSNIDDLIKYFNY